MDAQISPAHLAGFFAVAPLVLGLVIFFVAWSSKRNEDAPVTANVGSTFACASCGRRGSREHMVPQVHSGAITWYCPKCA